jgi:hypothetical protein
MSDRTLAQKLALLFGATFLAVGILGFIPGITTDLYDGLEFAGDDGTSELLGIFKVSILHNIVHLLFGVGILMAATHRGALSYLLTAGLIYGVVFLLGIVGGADWVPVNSADNALHAVLAAALLGSWAVARKEGERAPVRAV